MASWRSCGDEVFIDKSIELRRVKVGLTNGNMVEVLEGLGPGVRVVTKGSLFIDRAASGS